MELVMVPTSSLVWAMGLDEAHPSYRLGVGAYPRGIKVDPYPCYAHDQTLVQDILDMCIGAFPLAGSPARMYVIAHEGIGRTNGCTYEDTIYNRADGSDGKEEMICKCGCEKKLSLYGQAHSIILYGKRIPIMPEMTRYLVSHEYGHAVFHHIRRQYGYPEGPGKLEKHYMELRGVTDYEMEYGGGNWHRHPGEIIANDFRLLFTDQAREFWPHDCDRPRWDSEIGTWWLRAFKAITGK